MKQHPRQRRSWRGLGTGRAVLLLLLLACEPHFDDRTPLVSEPEIVAIASNPAEAQPRSAVTLEAKVAAPLGAEPLGPFEWSFCKTPPPVGDPRPVSEACGDEVGAPLLGDGASVQALVPSDACALFGPEPIPGGYRAADPDGTGGYYQPVRVKAFGASWVHLLRVTCELPNAPSDVARELAREYAPNVTPSLAAFEKFEDGAWVAFESARRGRTLAIRARWQPEAAENFVYLPVGERALVSRREALRVRWLSTSGHFALDASGRDESDSATSAENAWTADDSASSARFWLVLSDSRGASSVQEADVKLGAP